MKGNLLKYTPLDKKTVAFQLVFELLLQDQMSHVAISQTARLFTEYEEMDRTYTATVHFAFTGQLSLGEHLNVCLHSSMNTWVQFVPPSSDEEGRQRLGARIYRVQECGVLVWKDD